MRGTRGRGHHRQALVNRQLQSQLKQLRKELNGYTPRSRNVDPPVINQRPYYSLVVTLDGAAAGMEVLIGVSTLIKRVTEQLGLTSQAAASMVIKLKSVKGWAYQFGPAVDRVSINGEVSSLIPTVSDLTQQTTVNPVINYPVLYRFGDFGTLARPAHFAYVWPKAQQEMVLP
eukprot:UN34051